MRFSFCSLHTYHSTAGWVKPCRFMDFHQYRAGVALGSDDSSRSPLSAPSQGWLRIMTWPVCVSVINVFILPHSRPHWIMAAADFRSSLNMAFSRPRSALSRKAMLRLPCLLLVYRDRWGIFCRFVALSAWRNSPMNNCVGRCCTHFLTLRMSLDGQRNGLYIYLRSGENRGCQ